MDFGNRIQALRKQQGLSQEALADRLGVSRQAIGKWETGATLPSIDNLLELSTILNTTVDYLLTGREAENPLDYDAEPPQSISTDALRALLSEQQPKKRLHRVLLAAGAVCLLLVVGLLGYYITRLGALERKVSDLHTSVNMLDSQLQGALGSIQSGIQESLDQQASILSDSDYGLGDYDSETNTAAVYLSATPKTLTEDTTVCFVLSPMASSQDTLEQAITAEGHIPATEGPSPGAFTAEVQVPMVQDFVVSVLLEQDGTRHTETMMQQYGFASMYVCTMVVDSHSFSWSTSSRSDEVTLSGYPAIQITPAPSVSAPRPDTLRWELCIDGKVVESDKIDVYGEFFSADAEQSLGTDTASAALSGVTYYPSSQEPRSYPIHSADPDIRWNFTLTDTAGNVYEDSIEW